MRRNHFPAAAGASQMASAARNTSSHWAAIASGETKRAASSITKRTNSAKLIYSRVSRNPFEQSNYTHLGGLAVRGDILASLYLSPVLAVVLVGAPKHLFVGHGGTPAQAFLDARCIEEKIFRDHLVVIRTQRRNS